MANIVEDGTGLADANAYCTLAYADALHTSLGNSTWTGTDAAKEAAIARATIWVDANEWIGQKKTAAQALRWPRSNAIDRDGITHAGVPAQIKRATALAALKELAEPGVLTPDQERGGRISSVSVGGAVSVSFEAGAPAATTFTQIAGLLTELVRGKSALQRMAVFRSAGTSTVTGDEHEKPFKIGMHDNPTVGEFGAPLSWSDQ